LRFVLWIGYGLYLVFMLGTHLESFAAAAAQEEHHDHGAHWRLCRAVASLIIASVLAAWMSEILVGAAEGTDGRSNWYKGVQLIMVYAIMAFLFYFMPETRMG
jgi:Ca2+:H+ antiporter